ncbi:hypothetical protein BDW22DRAFT_169568 [Trametopsis cervina]|nr:hypothetical protein BDW22DRAFT_169568 [Trametopsis cervina]
MQPDSSLLRQDEARAEAFKPLICLSDLSLHSPSAIVGTPFDVSPRFEYPFPEDSSSSDSSIFGPSPFIPSYHSPVTFHPSIPTNRSYSPTHPKHTLRDPPVPPGLAKKRWSVGISMPLRHSRKRSRSANAVPSEEVSSGSMRAHMTQPGTETFDGAEDAGKPGVVAEEMTRPQRIDAGPNAAWGVVPSEDASASAESSLLDEYTKSLEEQNILNAVVEDEYEAQRPSTAPSSLI